jgi:hypothetical protein
MAQVYRATIIQEQLAPGVVKLLPGPFNSVEAAKDAARREMAELKLPIYSSLANICDENDEVVGWCRPVHDRDAFLREEKAAIEAAIKALSAALDATMRVRSDQGLDNLHLAHRRRRVEQIVDDVLTVSTLTRWGLKG